MKFLIPLSLLTLVCVSGATKYVSTTGDDTTGDGSEGNPWRNIRKGVLTMSAGDTLNIRGGEYDSDGFALAEFKTGLSTEAPTVIQSYPGELAIYRASTDFLNMVRIGGKSNIVISGIEFNADAQSSACFKIDNGSQRITLTNCTFKACHDGHGLLISPVSTGAEIGLHKIVDCRFVTNGWAALETDSDLHQIYTQNSSNIIERCYIEGVMNVKGAGFGIHDYSSDGYGNVYRYNYITNSNIGIGVVGNSQHDTLIYNNVIVGAVSYPVNVRNASNVWVISNSGFTNVGGIAIDTSTNIVVANNIMVGSVGANPGGVFVNACDTVTVQNNLSYDSFLVGGARTYDYRIFNSINITTADNLFTYVSPDPIGTEYNAGFADPLAGNLRLTTGSDAINAGIVSAFFSDDYSGTMRGDVWDIGAFEFQAPTKINASAANVGSLRGR